MMLTASVVSCVLFFALGFIVNNATKTPAPKIKPKALKYILLSGIIGCVYIRLNVALSAQIPSVIFFPVTNGGIVVITTAVGAWLFSERFNTLQTFGVVLGLIAIIITGCGAQILSLF